MNIIHTITLASLFLSSQPSRADSCGGTSFLCVIREDNKQVARGSINVLSALSIEGAMQACAVLGTELGKPTAYFQSKFNGRISGDSLCHGHRFERENNPGVSIYADTSRGFFTEEEVRAEIAARR